MRGVYLKDKTGNKVVTVPYYRIGDLFLTTIATNPSSYLGGKWELFGPGRCLVCVDTSQTEFNSVKKTGGEKTHKLTVNEMPQHNHEQPWNIYNTAGTGWYMAGLLGTNGGGLQHANWTGNNPKHTGGSQAHNNLQPFITCYVWIRTA